MKCTYCNKPLTKKQIKAYNYKYGKKRFPPKPVCSSEHQFLLRSAPNKSERKERWAQDDGHNLHLIE